MSSIHPIFVCGTGRSGTSVVYRALRSHKQIASGPTEFRLHIDPNGCLELYDSITRCWNPQIADYKIQKFVELIQSARTSNPLVTHISRKLSARGVRIKRYAFANLNGFFGKENVSKALSELCDELTCGSFRGVWAGSPAPRLKSKIFEVRRLDSMDAARVIEKFVSRLYRHRALNDEKYWIESTPYTFLHAQELLEIFPGAKFVHVYRDPRDVVASYMSKSWGGDDVSKISHRVRSILEKWDKVKKGLPEKSYTEVKIEDLTHNKRNLMDQLESFLSISPGFIDSGEIGGKFMNSGRWRESAHLFDEEFLQFSALRGYCE